MKKADSNRKANFSKSINNNLCGTEIRHVFGKTSNQNLNNSPVLKLISKRSFDLLSIQIIA